MSAPRTRRPDAEERRRAAAEREAQIERSREHHRTQTSKALVFLAVIVTVAVVLSDEFISGRSLFESVSREPLWAAPVASMLAAAPLFVWWRACAFPFGRALGVALAMIAGWSIWFLVIDLWPGRVGDGCWWALLPVAAAYVIAFLKAPEPESPEAREDRMAARLAAAGRRAE